jgi:hypothetical protein
MLPAIITSNPRATYILFSTPYSEKKCHFLTHAIIGFILFTGISKKIKRRKKMKHMDLCGERIQQILFIAYWVYALTESTGREETFARLL